MRLIDADAFIEKLQSELNRADEEKRRCLEGKSLQFDVAKGYAQGMAVAIEIVKSWNVSKNEQ